MIAAILVAAATLAGRWEGAVVRDNATQALTLQIRTTADGVAGTYDIPDLNLYGEPLDTVRVSGP